MSGTKKEPLRPDMRPTKAEAERRAAEILTGLGGSEEGQDEFYFDPAQCPDGWVYQWKRELLLGQEDPAYATALARTGWEPVPTSRHPEMMPIGGDHPVIRRKGMMLMQRPKMVDDHIRSLDARRAGAQIRAKEEQLAATPHGQLPRDADPRTKPKIGRSYEPMQVPETA